MRGPLVRLHQTAFRGQLSLVLCAIPLSATLAAVGLEPMVVDTLLSTAERPSGAQVHAAVITLLAVLAAVVWTSAIGASMLLSSSHREVVDEIVVATRAISRGDLAHRINSTRRDELGALAAAIDAMAGRLEALEHARRQMLACVSHELRTPLTVIQGHAFTLNRSEADPVRSARLQLMQEESSRLGRLIEDLVDASSLRAGSVCLRPARIDARVLVEAAMARLADEALRSGVALECVQDRSACWIDADGERIDQLLANLVSNGIRHASRGSTVTIACRRRRDGSVGCSVTNVGTRIDREDARRIFEPFEQGPSAPGRLGLGLAIARGLAAAHGGSLALTDPDAATRGEVTFELVLPSSRPGAVALAGVAPAAAHRARRSAVTAPRELVRA